MFIRVLISEENKKRGKRETLCLYHHHDHHEWTSRPIIHSVNVEQERECTTVVIISKSILLFFEKKTKSVSVCAEQRNVSHLTFPPFLSFLILKWLESTWVESSSLRSRIKPCKSINHRGDKKWNTKHIKNIVGTLWKLKGRKTKK